MATSPRIRMQKGPVGVQIQCRLTIVAAVEPWLRGQLETVPDRSDTVRAIRYALKNWGGLTNFLEDRRVELDTKTVERAIKP